ncbi:MAG: alpha/beta hydrolase family protein [Gaiellaceae bacterium]
MRARPGLAWLILAAALLIAAAAALAVPPDRALAKEPAALIPPSESGIARAELHLVPGAKQRPHPLLMTVGGPIYCMQIAALARYLHASRLCTDYGPNGYTTVTTRVLRKEDWGDPAYLNVVAQLPRRLRRSGVKISKLLLVGVSYSGYGNAELVATHPELRPAALIIIDTYLDLTSRYNALLPSHETRREMEAVIGGTPEQVPAAYASRSPSNHLDGLAQAIRSGMIFLDIWSVSPHERDEFRGATCSGAANAQWLSGLASVLGGPVTGYVTQMRHAHALWDWGKSLLSLAGLKPGARPLPAQAVQFWPNRPLPAGSTC